MVPIKALKLANKVLIGLIVVTTFFFAVGVAYSYFAADILGAETSTTLTAEAGYMTITYDGGANINATGFAPSTEPFATKEFTVKGTSTLASADMGYKLILVIDENTFINPISYTLESNLTGDIGGTSTISDRKDISSSNEVLKTAKFTGIMTDLTHRYKLKLYFYDNNEDQTIDMEKIFKAHISIENYESPLLSNHIINLEGTVQGTGKLTREKANIFEKTQIKDVTYYTNINNTGEYPFIWNNSTKKWEIEETDESILTFKPSSAGSVGICYEMFSEYFNESFIISVDNVVKRSIEFYPEAGCLYLGNLTPANEIKIEYLGNWEASLSFSFYGGTDKEKLAGYYYQGANPNNYISFNNELWRIVGVFDERTHDIANQNLVKIIKATANIITGEEEWDYENCTEWYASTLQYCFNDVYIYNLNMSSRNLIETVTWKIGGAFDEEITAEEFYKAERLEVEHGRDNFTVREKIGLIYPSDYGYSTPSDLCPRTALFGEYNYPSSCYNNSWITDTEWTITPKANRPRDHIFYLVNDIDSDYGDYINDNIGVRPALYLKADTPILRGNGTQLNPYIVIE